MATETTDCELRDDWFFEQDVNAWTSLAYVAVGVVVVVVVVRRRLPPAFIALGAVVALEGLGSALYHGRPSDAARLLHDVPMLGLLGFIAGWSVGRLHARGAELVALAGLVAGAVAGAAASAAGATSVVAAVLVVVAAGAEFLAPRRGLPAVWNVPVVLLGAVAAATWLGGTSDSPLCDAQSWLQPHGVWHVLSALAILGWTYRAMTTIAR